MQKIHSAALLSYRKNIKHSRWPPSFIFLFIYSYKSGFIKEFCFFLNMDPFVKSKHLICSDVWFFSTQTHWKGLTKIPSWFLVVWTVSSLQLQRLKDIRKQRDKLIKEGKYTPPPHHSGKGGLLRPWRRRSVRFHFFSLAVRSTNKSYHPQIWSCFLWNLLVFVLSSINGMKKNEQSNNRRTMIDFPSEWSEGFRIKASRGSVPQLSLQLDVK